MFQCWFLSACVSVVTPIGYEWLFKAYLVQFLRFVIACFNRFLLPPSCAPLWRALSGSVWAVRVSLWVFPAHPAVDQAGCTVMVDWTSGSWGSCSKHGSVWGWFVASFWSIKFLAISLPSFRFNFLVCAASVCKDLPVEDRLESIIIGFPWLFPGFNGAEDGCIHPSE